MDFCKGVSIPEEKDIQMQGSWIPVTPAKPIPARPQPISADSQESHLGQTNLPESLGFPAMLSQQTPTSDGAAACINSMRLDAWEAAVAEINRGSDHIAWSHMQRNATDGLNNNPGEDLLAFKYAASASANLKGNNNAANNSFFPVSYSQIKCSQQQHNSPSLLPGNQDFLLSSELWNNSNCQQPQRPQQGFPVPYSPIFDLNFPPRTMVDATSNGGTPATPDQGKRIQNQLYEEVNLSMDERSRQQKDKQEDLAIHHRNEVNKLYRECSHHMSSVNEVTKLHSEEFSNPIVDSSSTATISPLKGNHNPDKEDNHEMDLNKIPLQKYKRKKHRPKVIIEGKPKRTPKPVTPKQDSAKQNPPKKRKYVRKKDLKASNTPPTDALGEMTDPPLGPAAKSCKRTLNFNFDGQAKDKVPRTSLGLQEGLQHRGVDSLSYRWAPNLNSESRAQDFCNGVNSGSGTKSIVPLGQGIEVTINNTAAGIAYDLNSSMNQLIKDYISLPEKQVSTTLQLVRREPLTQSSKVLARNRNDRDNADACLRSRENVYLMNQCIQEEVVNHMVYKTGTACDSHGTTVPSFLQGDPRSISKNHNDTNGSHPVPFAKTEQAREWRREYSHIQPMNMIGVHYNSLQVYREILQGNEYNKNRTNLGPNFSQICKKKRTGNRKRRIISPTFRQAAQTYLGTLVPQLDNAKELENGIVMMTEQYHPVESIDLLTRTEALSKAAACMLSFTFTERKTKKRSKGYTRVRDLTSLTTIMHCNQFPSTPTKTAPTSSDGQGSKILSGPQDCMEALIADNHAKVPKKKRTKKGSSLVNSFSSEQKANDSIASSRSLNILPLYSLHNHYSRSCNLCGTFDSSWPEVILPIDKIVPRLTCLNINGKENTIADQEKNALVPYSGSGTMVPYEGPFYPTKKQQPRSKVNLDPETERMWNLLMGIEGSEGIEGMNEDKQKWWEEERKVFRGRADSFIARMHLIQGDRRFSKWKGSVVDSVVGVFLTQNVSDHLSSSAFISLAARFPLQSQSNHSACYEDGTSTSVKKPEMCSVDTEDSIKCNEKMSRKPLCDQGSVTFHETEHIEGKELAFRSFGSNKGAGSLADNSRGKQAVLCKSRPEMCHESPERTDILTTKTGTLNFVEAEDRITLEDAVSSQNSADSSIFQATERIRSKIGTVSFEEAEDRRDMEATVSSQNSVDSPAFQAIERIGSCSESNSEAEDLTTQSQLKPSNCFKGSTFMELLQMAGTTMTQEFHNCGSQSSSCNLSHKDEQKQLEGMESDQYRSSVDNLDCLKGSLNTTDSGVLEVECLEMSGKESISSLPSTSSEITETRDVDFMSKQNGPVPDTVNETTVQQKVQSSAQTAPIADPYESLNKHSVHPLYSLQPDAYTEKNPHSCNKQQRPIMKTLHTESTREPTNLPDILVQRQNSGMHQESSSPSFSGENTHVEGTSFVDKQKSIENKVIQSNLKEQACGSANSSTGTTTNNLKAKKVKKEKKKAVDWDSLRKQVYANGTKRERNSDTMDSVDWEAVRCADVNEVAKAIKDRGMNNVLAGRVKDFLNRLVREHGSIDLEWLRDVPPDQTKDYLLSIRGLGLKSVECVRLLTLHHLAFPVDTNVGRIAVRLGWVPLQPLPEELQLHLLEMYPMMESIQKYLWPRLCTLDQQTLYELHYQMITFGKVFCTKRNPNCNACPMRGECKHFASAFASARLALPGLEEKSMVSSTVPVAADQNPLVGINPMPLPLLEANPITTAVNEVNRCEPIIEVPATPEPDCTEISESDIEDSLLEDPDEIPTIKLNLEEFTLNLQNYMQESNIELHQGDMSKALVALTPEAASLPLPKLKNVRRLRTEHQVYVLPDSHPILNGFDRREQDDQYSYLLAIWTPGETADSVQPPKGSCGSQESHKLCNEKTCFSCNSVREADSQTVRGTILIPCRTAMRGSFPLNGTYFQVNEVFADHDSSTNPIIVPRAWIWNLPRRTVFFGTSIPTIFRGLSTEEIQSICWTGCVCVRGFDQKMRAPRPLRRRLHLAASKLPNAKTQANKG